MGRPKRKIGLVLGSFDPIHIGHLGLIGKALSEGMDLVLVVPCPQNPWKSGAIEFHHRLKMAEIAILDMFPGQAKIETGGDLESLVDDDGKYYSYKQLQGVIDRYGEEEYYIIGGTDLKESVTRWKNWDTLKDFFKLLIVERQDFTGPLGIIASSTAIREILRRGGDARPYLLRAVQYYIKSNSLYE